MRNRIVRGIALALATLGLSVPLIAAPGAAQAATYETKFATLNTGARPENVRAALNFVKSRNVQVIGLQEVDAEEMPALRTRPWNAHRGSGNGGGFNAVAWRNDLWRPVVRDQFQVSYRSNSAGRRTLHMPVVVLRHIRTGRKVTGISVHLPPRRLAVGLSEESARRQLRNQVYWKIVDWRQRRGRVIVMGDFNDSTRIACEWTRGGFIDATGYRAPSTGSCPTTTGVDRILSTSGRWPGHDWIPKSTTSQWGMDHPMLIARLRYNA